MAASRLRSAGERASSLPGPPEPATPQGPPENTDETEARSVTGQKAGRRVPKTLSGAWIQPLLKPWAFDMNQLAALFSAYTG